MKKNKFIFNLKNFSIVVVYILILSMFIGGCSKTKILKIKVVPRRLLVW